MKHLFILIAAILTWNVGSAQDTIVYSLKTENIQHHELSVSVLFSNLEMDTLEIRMPNASPGRYAIHQFAKNLYDEKASDGKGNLLAIIRATPSSWKIPVKDGIVKFEYTLYANHADGTYAGIDASKLHLNMPAVFAYGVDLDQRAIGLKIDLSDQPEWSVATQLQKVQNDYFTAPNYYYFYDSPTMVGKIIRREWEVDGQTIEVAMQHFGTEKELDNYVDWIKRIVIQEKAIYGELPRYDFGRYTFLISYTPWVFNDAMEHRNSTVCTSMGTLARHAPLLIGSIAHEFFHSWNIERIRPKSLEPFNFDEPNMSGELWFGEGFTNYYDELAQCRAGVITQENFLNTAADVYNSVKNAPGRTFRNPVQMSCNAPFVDAAKAIDETNYQNNFISYYTYGEFLGLALDLSIRSSFKNLSLDDYMRFVWLKYGKTEIPYTLKDLQQALADVTKSEKFANNFFESYIHNSEIPDMEALFGKMGINSMLEKEGKVHFGKVSLDKYGAIENQLTKGTALYEAGLDKGDILVAINDMKISKELSLDALIEKLEINKEYKVDYVQMGQVKSGVFITKQDPEMVLNFDKKASSSNLKMLEAWLSPK
jgi:predicted metalloprotease with PDZ domain